MSQEKFDGLRRRNRKGRKGNIPDGGTQEGSGETEGNTPQASSSKPGLTNLRKLALIGGVSAIIGIVSSVVLRKIRKDDSDIL